MPEGDNMYRIIVMLAMFLLLGACTPTPQSTGPLVSEGPPIQATFIPEGEVVAIGLQETVMALRGVVNNAPGTFIMQSLEGDFLFAWPSGSNYGFLAISRSTQPVNILNGFVSANKTNTLSMADLTKQLESGGWKYILPTQLPVALYQFLTCATTQLLEWSASLITPFIFIVPGPLEMPGREEVIS
jgi:hypothetical protein